MQTRASTWQQIWGLIVLKYRLNRRGLTASPKEKKRPWLVWLRMAVLIALSTLISFTIYSRYNAMVAHPTGRTEVVSRLTLILGGLLLYHILAPFSVFRTGRELDLQRLLPMPLGFPTIMAARSLASLLEPEILLSLPPYVALAAALSPNASLVLSVLLLIAFFAAAIALGQALYTVVEVAYQRRWLREIIFGLFVSLACLTFVAAFFILGDAPERGITLEKWRATALAISAWLPNGWTARAIGELGQGNYGPTGGFLLALLGCTSVPIWASNKALESLYYRLGYQHLPSKRRTGSAAPGRFPLLERLLSRETIGMLTKELLIFRRSPWWFLYLVMWPLMVVGAFVSIPALRHPSASLAMAFACLGALEALQGMNALAAEAKSLPALLTLPAPRQSLLVGKNLRLLISVSIEMLIGFTVYLILANRLRYLPAMLFFNLSMNLIVLSVSNLISVRDPQQVSAFEFLPRMTMRSFLTCIAGSVAGGLPILGLLWLIDSNPGWLTIACLLSTAYGLLFYRLGILMAANYLARKEKDILAMLA